MIKLIIWDLHGVLYKNGKIADHAPKLIKKIESMGIENSCISNLPERTVRQIGEKLNLRPIISSSRLNMNKKNREVYDYLLEKTGFSADKCLMIDDLKANLIKPKELGMTVVLFGQSSGNDAIDYQIENIEEILQIIKNKRKN